MTGPNPSDSGVSSGPGIRLATATAIAALSLFLTLASGRQRGDFRIDEAHKLSETYYLRLLARRDFSNPGWFVSQVERANPPAGKYLLGAAIRAGGLELPRDLEVASRVNHGQLYPPSAALEQYRDYLAPTRMFIAIVTALTAALVFLLGAELNGLWCGIIAALLYATSFLTEAFSATASFDPLLTFFVTLAAVPTLLVLRTESAAPHTLLAAAAGIVCSLAFGTRVTGLMSLAAVFAMLGVWGLLSKRIARAAALALVAGLSCAFAAITMNPYYWARSTDPAVPPELRGVESLPGRVVHRTILQLRDLKTLEARDLHEQAHLLGLAKPRFVAEYVFGDLTGMTILAGLALFAVRLALRREATTAQWVLFAWCAAIIIILTGWLPLGYPRYVLVTIPPFTLLAAMGWSGAVHSAIAEIQKRRRIQLTTRSVTPK
jgi:4-amino-4-deoxy-L-arabinose transferase-like glycosyltransferase